MSYCVNCGVELDSSIKKCPLCQTPVINPNDLEKLKQIQSPFPEQKGIVENVNKKDIVIVVSVILACIMVSCSLLNYFVLPVRKWSLLVDGFCGLLWIGIAPPMIVKHPRLRIMALCNGIMAGIYLCLIGMFVDDFDWVIDLGLPITGAVIFLSIIFLTIGKHKREFGVLAPLFFMEVGALCIAIELLIDRMMKVELSIGWSAIVLTVCFVVAIGLITTFSRQRIRSAVQRRFHL